MTSELFIRFKRKPARVDYAASHMQMSARMELFLPVQTSDAAEISAVDTACFFLCGQRAVVSGCVTAKLNFVSAFNIHSRRALRRTLLKVEGTA